MTTKFERFVVALEALCKEHRVQLAPSDYDIIEVWDLREGDDLIHGGINDRTQEGRPDPTRA